MSIIVNILTFDIKTVGFSCALKLHKTIKLKIVADLKWRLELKMNLIMVIEWKKTDKRTRRANHR